MGDIHEFLTKSHTKPRNIHSTFCFYWTHAQPLTNSKAISSPNLLQLYVQTIYQSQLQAFNYTVNFLDTCHKSHLTATYQVIVQSFCIWIGISQKKGRWSVGGINKKTIPDCYPIPRIDDLIDTLGQCCGKIFTTLDLMKGYHQIKMASDSKEKQLLHVTWVYSSTSGCYKLHSCDINPVRS